MLGVVPNVFLLFLSISTNTYYIFIRKTNVLKSHAFHILFPRICLFYL